MTEKRTYLSRLDPETRLEVQDYLRDIRASRSLWLDVMRFPKARKDMKYWLRSKMLREGPADPDVVDEIGRAGRIHRPVILDASGDYTVEGRHRLAAALKWGLDVPVLILSD